MPRRCGTVNTSLRKKAPNREPERGVHIVNLATRVAWIASWMRAGANLRPASRPDPTEKSDVSEESNDVGGHWRRTGSGTSTRPGGEPDFRWRQAQDLDSA